MSTQEFNLDELKAQRDAALARLRELEEEAEEIRKVLGICEAGHNVSGLNDLFEMVERSKERPRRPYITRGTSGGTGDKLLT